MIENELREMLKAKANTVAPGSDCRFESREFPFPQVGIKIRVLEPGQPNGIYHSENQQEDFLVLSGECRLLVEGEERLLRPWDFVHCPPGTHHIFVAGDRPCVILMVGARLEHEELHYPVSELAARYGASPSSRCTRGSSRRGASVRRTGTSFPGLKTSAFHVSDARAVPRRRVAPRDTGADSLGGRDACRRAGRPVGFANSGGLVFVDESAEEVAAA